MRTLICFSHTFRQCCTNIACAPFFLLAIIFYSLYYCWPYTAQLPEHMSAAIVDEDKSPLSRRLVQELRASPRLDVRQVTGNRPEAIAAMKDESVVTVIGIPPDFEKDALHGIPTAMTLVANGAFIVKSRSSISGAAAPLEEAAQAAVAEQLLQYGYPASQLAALAKQPPPLIVQPMYNSISAYLNFVVPIVFMIIIQTLMICGTGMLFNDWFSKKTLPDTLAWLLSSPACLLSAQGPVFCFTLFWSITIEGSVFALHGINSFQNIPATLLVCIFFALSVSSLAMLAGILLGPTRFVIQAVVTSSIPCVFISGNLWPAQNIPVYMRVLSFFIPSSPGSCGMLRASQCGATVLETLPYLMHLGALAVLYILLAMLACKWRKQQLLRGYTEKRQPGGTAATE